jgi:hypothetical protein
MHSSMKRNFLKLNPTLKKVLNKSFSSASKSENISASQSFHEVYTRELEKLKKHS